MSMKEKKGVSPAALQRILLVAAMTAVLAFLPTTVLFLIGTLGLLGKRNWRQTLFLSILLPVALYGLFSGLLHVMLP